MPSARAGSTGNSARAAHGGGGKVLRDWGALRLLKLTGQRCDRVGNELVLGKACKEIGTEDNVVLVLVRGVEGYQQRAVANSGRVHGRLAGNGAWKAGGGVALTLKAAALALFASAVGLSWCVAPCGRNL